MSCASRVVSVFFLLSSCFGGCAAFEEPCPATPTPCRNDARIQVDLGPAGAITDPLVAYRLTIAYPAYKDYAGAEQPAGLQRCLFSTPQNLVRCDQGPFTASIGVTFSTACNVAPPDVSVNGDGGIVVDPGDTSCQGTVSPAKLELATPLLPEAETLTLTLERGEERFVPLTVASAVIETRPDGPKCGNTCRERLAPLTLAQLMLVPSAGDGEAGR